MTICSIFWRDGRDKNCSSACCYSSGRAVFAVEIPIIGEENVDKSASGRYYLKSKEDSAGACVLLDEDSLACKLEDNRPFNCKNHSCATMNGEAYQCHLDNIKLSRKKRGLNPP